MSAKLPPDPPRRQALSSGLQPVPQPSFSVLLERIEAEQRALHPNRELRDPGECPEVSDRLVLRRIVVAVQSSN